MLHVVLVFLQISIFIALILVLYRWLFYRLRRGDDRMSLLDRRRLIPLISLLGVIVIAPWLLTWISFQVGVLLFTNVPALKSPSWDVALAFSSSLGMIFSYVVGAIAALIIMIRMSMKTRSRQRRL